MRAEDEKFMRMALQLAAKGAGRVSPNPMVGAVVVKDGRVVGQGYHQAVGGPHAEVHAIDDAADAALGATLYVTLEPCHHFGRTPPCTHKIVEAGIVRVVMAMPDPNPDVRGGGAAFLRSHGLELIEGIEEAAARKLNESFVKYVRTKQPFVVLKMAATLDGRIATRSGDARWVTGTAARSQVHRLRHNMDAILVGIGTVQTDDPRLTARLETAQAVDPARFVLDTHLRMSPQARMLDQDSTAPTYVVCGAEAAADKRRALADQGAQVMEIPLKKGRIDLRALMSQMGRMQITSLLIEGGGQVAASALADDIVDKIIFFYAPKLLGGDDGVPMCRGQGPQLMKDALKIDDVTVSRMGHDIMIEGYRHSPSYD